jgi:hypothetical protein
MRILYHPLNLVSSTGKYINICRELDFGHFCSKSGSRQNGSQMRAL